MIAWRVNVYHLKNGILGSNKSFNFFTVSSLLIFHYFSLMQCFPTFLLPNSARKHMVKLSRNTKVTIKKKHNKTHESEICDICSIRFLSQLYYMPSRIGLYPTWIRKLCLKSTRNPKKEKKIVDQRLNSKLTHFNPKPKWKGKLIYIHKHSKS